MGILGLHNSVSDIAGKVHEQGNQAFNKAKNNVGNAHKPTTMNTPNTNSWNTDDKQNNSLDQLDAYVDNNAQGSSADNNGQSGSMSNQTPQKMIKYLKREQKHKSWLKSFEDYKNSR